jgi:hypothetical protein
MKAGKFAEEQIAFALKQESRHGKQSSNILKCFII